MATQTGPLVRLVKLLQAGRQRNGMVESFVNTFVPRPRGQMESERGHRAPSIWWLERFNEVAHTRR